jgi:putative flippase GtrA
VVIKNKAEKLRFGAVGVINTFIDMGLLFALTTVGLPTIGANIISTSCAFTFSFFANRTFTFHANGNTKKQFILFVAITLFGLWVLQHIVIAIVTFVLAGASLEKSMSLLIAKLLAVGVSLVWNYTMYSRFVFKRH